jgi:3-oxoadipate CoA-transferase alpha subunit
MRKLEICQSLEDAVSVVTDGASIMISGFGPGTPWNLLTALYQHGAKDLTLIANGVGFPTGRADVRSTGDLVLRGRVRSLISSFTAAGHPSRAGSAEALTRAGALETELVPQGTLAERIRAGGAGIPAFFVPAGAGTLLAEGKRMEEFDGRPYLMERSLTADFAFLHARQADTAGNLVYRMAGRNFAPLMATAATTVIVEVVEPIFDAGAFAPDQVHTPGVFVSRLVQIPPEGILEPDPSILWGADEPAPDGLDSGTTDGGRA